VEIGGTVLCETLIPEDHLFKTNKSNELKLQVAISNTMHKETKISEIKSIITNLCNIWKVLPHHPPHRHLNHALQNNKKKPSAERN